MEKAYMEQIPHPRESTPLIPRYRTFPKFGEGNHNASPVSLFSGQRPGVVFRDIDFLTATFGLGREPKRILMITRDRTESWEEEERRPCERSGKNS
jgi:hypothetical protein